MPTALWTCYAEPAEPLRMICSETTTPWGQKASPCPLASPCQLASAFPSPCRHHSHHRSYGKFPTHCTLAFSKSKPVILNAKVAHALPGGETGDDFLRIVYFLRMFFCFSVWGSFPCYLQRFGAKISDLRAICCILEPKSLWFACYLLRFWTMISHFACYLQHVGAEVANLGS